MTITAIIGRLKGGPKTAADLRSIAAEIDLPAAQHAVDDLTAARASALLEATDADVAKIEDKLVKATRDRDRCIVARDELLARLKMAEEAEAKAALDELASRAEQRAAAAAARLSKALEKHGSPIAEALAEAVAADAEVAAANRRLGQAGRSTLAEVESRMGNSVNGLRSPSVVGTTSLPPLGSSPGWGASVVHFQQFNGLREEVAAFHDRVRTSALPFG